MKKLFILVLIPFFAIACDGQSRTNRLYRPCPNSSTPAIVEVEADGDINVRPCSGKTLQQNGTPINIAQPFELIAAASDETTAITASATVLTFHVPRNFTATQIWAGLSTVSSSGVVTVNIKKNGTTVFSTLLTVDANEETSLTAATPSVLSTTTFTQGDKVTIDIDTAGTGAKGLKIYFIGTR